MKPGSIDDEVKLEYRDEFGRVPTKKEQFRLLSHRFHGIAPGFKNWEKRLQKLEREMKLEKVTNDASAMPTLDALRKAQQKDGKAHMVLS